MNTRLNPTLNGLPHLGHAYLALVNQHAARDSGGSLTFRGEDNQTAWLKKFTMAQMQDIGARWVDDLAWLGVTFDDTCFESDMDAQVRGAIHMRWPGLEDVGAFADFPKVIGVPNEFYPYTRYLTAKVALLDYANSIDTLIVGIDLLPRFALYQDMIEVFGLRPVAQIFLPRLEGHDGLRDVSKTNGTHQIRTYREAGWSALAVLELLRDSCLIDPGGEWALSNVKSQPRLVTA